MARLVENALQLSGLREKCLDFAIRIIEAKGKEIFGTPLALSGEATKMAEQFEEFINSRP